MSRPRIVSVDILRGFALFGMILVHFHQAFRESVPGLQAGWGEDAIGWVVWWGVEQKAASTLALSKPDMAPQSSPTARSASR